MSCETESSLFRKSEKEGRYTGVVVVVVEVVIVVPRAVGSSSQPSPVWRKEEEAVASQAIRLGLSLVAGFRA
jgi:hypothetical protein